MLATAHLMLLGLSGRGTPLKGVCMIEKFVTPLALDWRRCSPADMDWP